MKILVTGASGFIGRGLCQQLERSGFETLRAVRQYSKQYAKDSFVLKDCDPDTDWRSALKGIDVVIHLASRVHITQDKTGTSLSRYRVTNVLGTKKLVADSIQAGVKRFVFLSSIKVNGDVTLADNSGFNENDVPRPIGSYSLSKWEAEQYLNQMATDGKIETVIIRPPLVYGPGVKANFLSLLKWIHRGIPLPLSDVKNKRSFIGLDNLVDIIIRCLNHPDVNGETYNVSDGDDASTTELIALIAYHMNKAPKTFRVNADWMKWLCKLVKKESIFESLWGSLLVDSTKIKRQIGWNPVASFSEGIKKTVDWYLNEQR